VAMGVDNYDTAPIVPPDPSIYVMYVYIIALGSGGVSYRIYHNPSSPTQIDTYMLQLAISYAISRLVSHTFRRVYG
jgi:hypothetical protein